MLTKEKGRYSGIEQLVDIMWKFWNFIQINLKKQLAKANCLAPSKREERFIRSKTEIRVLDVKT
ncbi:hypothetical protein MRBLBA71_005876 [Bacillus nitratireducens]